MSHCLRRNGMARPRPLGPLSSPQVSPGRSARPRPSPSSCRRPPRGRYSSRSRGDRDIFGLAVGQAHEPTAMRSDPVVATEMRSTLVLPARQKSARRGAITTRTSVQSSQIWRFPQAKHTAGPAPGGFVWIFLTVARSSGPHEVGFPLCAPLPVSPVRRPNRRDNLPCSVFPFHTSKSAQPDERHGICAFARERREAICPVGRE